MRRENCRKGGKNRGKKKTEKNRETPLGVCSCGGEQLKFKVTSLKEKS